MQKLKLAKGIKDKISKAFSFMEKVYKANWTTRWENTPYMPSFAGQEKVRNFIENYGKFEPISGHTWAAIGFWIQLRNILPSLNKLVDSNEIIERLWYHDLGEILKGDVSEMTIIREGVEKKFEDERKSYSELINFLPKDDKERLLKWFYEFESDLHEDLPLEAIVVRWIDNLQGDHFALTFGNNFQKSSPIIEKIVKKRSARTARMLIKILQKRRERTAAKEIDEVMRFHIEKIREAGVKLDLSGLGF